MSFTTGSPRFGAGSSTERRTRSGTWRRTASRGLSNCRFNNQQSKAGLRLRPKATLPSLSAILFEARLRVKGKRDLGTPSSPGAKEEFTTERTEVTEKSTSSRANRDYKVTVPRFLAHSLCLHFFSVTSVVSVVLMANFVAWREEKQILLPRGGIRMTCHSERSAA